MQGDNMPGDFFPSFMKAVGMALIISIFTGLILSFIFMEESKIFSSWFVDVYKPSKAFILEKPPIRLIFFGEASSNASPENISKIINSLNKVEYKNYQFNKIVDVNFMSSLKGDRQRDAGKTVDISIKSGEEGGNIVKELVPEIVSTPKK
jgi:hypothetical protein